VEITGADMGHVQTVDRLNNALELVAHRGFAGGDLERLRDIHSQSETPWGRELASRRRVIVPDIAADPTYRPGNEAAGSTGYRAVQSTPLLSRDGRVLGVLSTFYAEPRTPSDRDLRLLDLYTQQAADYIDRRRAEEEISTSVSQRQASEEKYRQLFESIDEGFCFIQLLSDGKETAHDYRFLDTNPAFEKNTGLSAVADKTMRELAPKHEPMWVETFARIARTGTPERFEGFAEPLGRYFDVYAFRTGDPSHQRLAVLLRDVSERTAAQERQRLLLAELNHRVKNTLATVQSIANHTMVTAPDPADFVERFRGRLAALAEAHDLLTQSNWQGAELNSMLRKLLVADGDGDKITLAGPVVQLRPQAALSLSLLLYELGTNARKYGALSGPEGQVRISWSVVGRDGERHLDLDWIERDGPSVTKPDRSGFGKALIEQGLKGVGGRSELRFEPGGVSCRVLLPLTTPESERNERNKKQ
jgi:PAS domain S-box-containing protein